MIQFPVVVEIVYPDLLAALHRMADALEALRPKFPTFTITLGGLMPTYKSDRADFDFNVVLGATDSEGNVISDAPIPTGHTLTVTSDNTACFEATQDAANSKLVHCHVGGPNADGTPSQANVTANLFDPSSNLVATGAAQVTVTVGDPTAITELVVNLPAE